MYYSWTGKICIFITVINFPDNNRHTTVFHEKAYFSTIMEYFLQDIIAPIPPLHWDTPRTPAMVWRLFGDRLLLFPHRGRDRFHLQSPLVSSSCRKDFKDFLVYL